MPVVKFTENLRRFYPELKTITIEGNSLPELLDDIDRLYPRIKDYIVDEQGGLRKHVNIFIGNELIVDRLNLTDSIKDSDEIYIMQALSGG